MVKYDLKKQLDLLLVLFVYLYSENIIHHYNNYIIVKILSSSKYNKKEKNHTNLYIATELDNYVVTK